MADRQIYEPEPPPQTYDADYLYRELQRVSLELTKLGDGQIDKTYVEPDKPRDGMVRYADGDTWNPGDGKGQYRWDGSASAWIKVANYNEVLTDINDSSVTLQTNIDLLDESVSKAIRLAVEEEVSGMISAAIATTLAGDVKIGGDLSISGVLILETPVYDDYLFSGLALGKQGATAPSLKAFRGDTDLVSFDDGASVKEGFFSIHFLHGTAPDTTATMHLHWAHNDVSASGVVKWNVDYHIAKGYGTEAFPSATHVSVLSTAGPNSQYVHFITNDDGIPIAGSLMEPDSFIIGRVWRDPTDSDDTLGVDAFLIGIDIHFQKDRIGTPERNRPFGDW